MDERTWWRDSFEEHRPHLRAVAYRMLGSVSEADDAVQDAWLRVERAGATGVDNIGGWLTTVVSRVCLNMLRSRGTRGEVPLDVRVPDPVVTPEPGTDPETEAVLADSVGLALLVVLEQLAPAERLAFVLHDTFGVPFADIAPMIERTPEATRQLASRARRRVRGSTTDPDTDVPRQRAVVDAFFAAARDGDLDRLVSVLHPDVVLRSQGAHGRPTVISGAHDVASSAPLYSRLAPFVRPVLVNGAAGALVLVDGRAVSVLAFVVTDGRIAAIDVLSDPARLAGLDLSGVLPAGD
ncbi:RNA polymerase sigma factor SigJ [Promicromonospora xylanilytica]